MLRVRRHVLTGHTAFSFLAHAYNRLMGGSTSIWLGARVKYPYINECLFKSSYHILWHLVEHHLQWSQNGETGTHQRVAVGGVLSSHHGRLLSVEWQLYLSLHCVSQLGCHLSCRSEHAQHWMVGHRCNEMVNSGVASHIWVKGYPWSQPCARRSRVHRWGVLLARWKLPFPERVPWIVGEWWADCIGCFGHLPSALYVFHAGSSIGRSNSRAIRCDTVPYVKRRLVILNSIIPVLFWTPFYGMWQKAILARHKCVGFSACLVSVYLRMRYATLCHMTLCMWQPRGVTREL